MGQPFYLILHLNNNIVLRKLIKRDNILKVLLRVDIIVEFNKILANYTSPPVMTLGDVSEVSYHQESYCKDDDGDNLMS